VRDFVLFIFLEKGQNIILSYSSHNPPEHWVQIYSESVLIFWVRMQKWMHGYAWMHRDASVRNLEESNTSSWHH